MPRILDDLNEDPEFQALSPAAKTAVMQAAKRKPLVTMDAADPAPPKKTRSVVEREPAPDPLDAYLPKKPPVPKAVSAKFKRSKEQDSVDQLAEDSRNRRIGMTGPALTAERLRENLAGAALQGAKDMGNPVQLGAEALGAALARPALDAIAEDDERKRPAIERAADRSPAARRIQPNYRPKDTIEYVAEFLQPIEDAGRQIAADPADALDPTRPGTAEGQAAFLGATGANLVDPIGDGAIGLAAKGAGKLAKAATNAIDPRARIASRVADAARAAERTGADLGGVGRVDPATQSGVLLDDGTPQKSWPERLDNLGQQTARRARGGVMKRGVDESNAEDVMRQRAAMMDDANRMQDTARSLLAGPERPAPATPLSPENYAPDGEMSPRTQRIAGDLRESIEQVEAAKRRPVPPAVTNMFVAGRPDPTPAQPGGGSALEPWQMRRDDFMRERVRPSRASEAPTLDRMIRNLRSPEGPPGISIENDYMPRFESEDPSIKMVVARGQDGRPIGVLRVFLDEGGQPDLISVAVDPAQRRQGVATSLYDAAKRAGYDVDRASGTEGLTDEGAAFNHARRVRDAVAEGRPVPPEVLTDYPGLAPGQEIGGSAFTRRLASEEDGAFRPGAIGDTLRRLFGRDKAPIPAPQAAITGPPASTPADAAALTIERLPASRAGIPLEEINLDPKTYQFKESDAKTGRNARFKDSDEWDPDYLEQKQVIVHRRLDGRFYVADGHQRVNLARVRQQKGDVVPPLNAIVLDEAQGWTPELVKIKASKINLGEATGSAVDVARLMRDSGVTAKALGLSDRSNLAIHGGYLSTLDDEALGFVANRGIDPAHASEAVKASNDPAMRLAILREIADDKPRDATEAALIARDAVEAGIAAARPADQLSMVNLGDYSKSRRKTLYKVLSELEKQLRQQGTALKGAAANKEVLEGVEGSAINAAGTQAAATEAESLLQYLKSQAGLAGPFREAVKALAKEVEGGKPLSEAVAHARRQLSADLGLHARGGVERPGAVPPSAGVAGLQDDAAGAPAGSVEGAPAAGVAPGPVAPAQAGPGLFGDQAQFEAPPAPGPEPAAPPVTEAQPTLEPLPPEVAAQPAPFEPLPPEDYDPLVGYLPDTRIPPASTPEAGGPVVGRPRADLARPASPTDQKALDDAYRMRDRFVRSGNQRAVDEFQTRIDAIEAKYAAAPPPPPQSAKQLQGRLNMLKRHLREARAAGNSQRAGELSAQVDEIDGILNGSARWPDREPGVPLEDRSPRARANEREALQQQDLTKARRIDDGIHKRMHNLPGDPDNIAASIFENFRVNGGSPEESAILAEGVRRVMARADWNPHARVPFADVLQEAAETDPALVEELIRRGVPKDQMIPVQMQTALRQRQGQLQSFIADLRKEEERAILGQDIEGAQELGNAIQKAERDLDAILEITVPMGSKYARALRMEGLTAKREGFDTTFWMARVRRNATGDTMRPAPPKIERRVKEATSKGNEAKATKANALEQLRAMGIDTAALEAPATVESVMRESGLTRFMGKLKDWGMTARPGAIFPARMPGSATTPAVTKRQPPPMPDLSHLTPEQRATAEMLWREAADARIAEREAQVELTRTAADARMTTIPEAITNTRRAFLIAGVKTFERNILSNLSNIPLEGASKAIAAVPDRALSMLGLTKEPGARTIRLRQFQDVGSAMKTSVPQGFKEWGEILRHGQTAEDIARQEVVVEQNTGFPAWDGVVNIVFRNQAGADRPTYLYGYARSLQRQAWNLFPNDEAARRAFIANPPEAVANEALADAAFGVYQNDTTMNQALQGLGSTLRRGGTGGRGLAWVYDNLGALYKKTPSAVATRTTVDFTPIGAAARVLDALWENGLQKLNPEAQKAVTMAIGRGAVGTGVIATGWALAGQGAMTGYYRPDFKEEILTSGRTPGSIYFKGEWVPLQWLGPVGHLLAIGATLREAGAGTVLPFSDMGNWPTMAATGAGAAMQSVVDSPMAQSAKQMQEIMQPDERTAYQKGNKLAGSFVQGFIPSVINEFARARDTQADGYGRRRAVDDTSTTGAMVDSLKSRIPGLRETLPMAVDDLGREVREPGGAGAFMAWSGRPSEESQDRVVRAIIETGADLRGAQSSLRDAGGRGRADDVSIRLDPAQERDYRSTRGQAIYAEVAKALDSQAYQDAMRIGDPDRLRELVQDAIGRGSKSGTKAYRAREGSTIKDGRARALAEKDRRRDVRALPAAPWWDEPSATVPPALRGRTSTPASP